MQKMQKKIKTSNIVALCIVSESEIARAFPEYDYTWKEQKPTLFNLILFQLGMDITKSIEVQEGLTHRNRLNQIVLCARFVGQERIDYTWLTSGYASQEAKDKASGSKMLEDLYRAKNLTQDRQLALEAKDKYKYTDNEYDK